MQKEREELNVWNTGSSIVYMHVYNQSKCMHLIMPRGVAAMIVCMCVFVWERESRIHLFVSTLHKCKLVGRSIVSWSLKLTQMGGQNCNMSESEDKCVGERIGNTFENKKKVCVFIGACYTHTFFLFLCCNAHFVFSHFMEQCTILFSH